MNPNISVNVNGNIILIEGNISSVGDYHILKKTFDDLKYTKWCLEERQLILELKDSRSITSSVLGLLNRLVQKDKIELITKVRDKRLFELFDDLEMKDLLGVYLEERNNW